jgi:hypothetical protein
MPNGKRWFNMQAIVVQLVPLHLETRTALPTSEAAAQLCRSEQTLRLWACKENGPIRPIRVNGRLAWPVSEIKRVLGVA